jgi:hypothetical protein
MKEKRKRKEEQIRGRERRRRRDYCNDVTKADESAASKGRAIGKRNPKK